MEPGDDGRARAVETASAGGVRPVAQSAVVPYRRTSGDARVLLVTSKISNRWVLPKGMIEEGMTAAESAVKEAFEEGGVLGVVDGPCLGQYGYVKRRPGRNVYCTVLVFPMRVTDELAEWPERPQRHRAWMRLAEAEAHVQETGLKRILRAFRPPRTADGAVCERKTET